MKNLSKIAPVFVSEVCESLSKAGHKELEDKIRNVVIEQYTYDIDSDAGYIYMHIEMSPIVAAVHNETAVVKETISLGSVNIDIDHEGNIFGIELLGRPEVIREIESANTL